MSDQTHTVESVLGEYEELLAMRDVLTMQIQDQRKSVIPHDVQVELDNIDIEYAGKLEAVDEKLAALKKALQDQAKFTKQRVDGKFMQVIYQKPSWKIKDLVRLLQLAIKTPEIMDCIEQGEPVGKVQPMKGGK